ncbi:MAG: ABC transporter permease [Phycisphaerales bacterium]|nr:MAG: ABC transporter permease [Phycisphaerales bacterium]
MFFLRICMMAIRGLQANLLRSLLATLGVIIGVSAVVSAMSILEGANRDILERFESMGADQIMVVNGSSQRQSRHTVLPSLTPEDAEALEELSLVKAVAPEVQAPAQIKYFRKNRNVTILGTTEAYAQINDYKAAAGQFITHEEVRAERKVCVLGHKVAKELFGEATAVGYRVKIRGMPFHVVGVMEKKGFLGFREVDNQVVVPLPTAMKRMFGLRNVTMITVQAKRQDLLEACIQQVKRTLRNQHSIRAGSDDDFIVFTQEQAKEQLADITKIFAVVLYSIAGISLVVGGIGIMNIMLVSVTERTREIGVRIAVGATRFDILRQFLIEAGIISLLGGVLGVLLGLAFTDLLENITRVLHTYTPSSSIYWALIMATAVGVLSGIYPAFRASRLDPVEALRYE